MIIWYGNGLVIPFLQLWFRVFFCLKSTLRGGGEKERIGVVWNEWNDCDMKERMGALLGENKMK